MLKQVGKTISESMRVEVGVHNYESLVLDGQINTIGDSRPTVSVIIPTLNEARNLPLV